MKRLTLILVALMSTTAFGQELRLGGPVRIQDMSLLALLRLDMVPPPLAPERMWRVEVGSSDANVYAMSDAARRYLQKRARRQQLTEEEAREMLESPREVFFFDEEVTITRLSITRRLTKHNELEVAIPYFAYGGGYLDSIIESFHRQAGLRDARRDFVPRNGIALVSRIGGTDQVFLAQDGDSGIGDATITWRYSDELSKPWNYMFEGAAQLPTGRDQLYFSAVSASYAAQASLQRVTSRQGIYLTMSYVLPGRTRMLPNNHLSNVPTAIAAYEHAFASRMSAIGQLSWSSGGFREETGTPDITRTRRQASVALRRHYSSSMLWLALIENVGSYRNTPDIVIHAGLTFTR